MKNLKNIACLKLPVKSQYLDLMIKLEKTFFLRLQVQNVSTKIINSKF